MNDRANRKQHADKESTMNTKPVDLPNALKAKLLGLAKHLPENGRKEFIQRVSQRLGEVVEAHPNTLVFSTLGFLLGLALDRLLIIHLPFVGLTLEVTGGKAVLLGFLSGSVYGLMKDHSVERELREIIASELERAMSLARAEGFA